MAARYVLKPGDRVLHRNLDLRGTVCDPVGMGVDLGWTTLVAFDDGDDREVSTSQLDKLEEQA